MTDNLLFASGLDLSFSNALCYPESIMEPFNGGFRVSQYSTFQAKTLAFSDPLVSDMPLEDRWTSLLG